MKYIIDLPDTCQWVQWINLSDKDGHAYFDFKSPEDLTPLDKELSSELGEAYHKGFEAGSHEATTLEYQRGLEDGKKQAKAQAELDVCHDIEKVAREHFQKGLEDAWECAKKLFSEMSNTEINLVFPQEWNNGGFKALMALHPQDAIDRIKAYEEQQKIKVGDIITDGKINYLVIDITDKSYIALKGTDFEPSYIGKDYIGLYHNLHDSKDMRKVAEEISKAIKSEQRNCSTCKHIRFNSIKCTECFSYKGYNRWEPKEGAE